MVTALDTFEGFPETGFAFLEGLETDNTKSYFDANRDAYRRGLFEPAKSFVAELGEELRARVSPSIVADPSVNGSLFRINRDIRFSKDKTPYKTHVGMYFWQGDSKKTSPGLYVGLDADGVTLGVGLMPFPDLERWRSAVADDVTGQAWVSAVRGAETDGPLDVGGEQLKRVPRPHAQDHPRGDWLRYKSLHMGRHSALPAAVQDPGFVDWATKRLEPLGPVLEWLAVNAAGSS